jgi:hypothetical protein
MLTEWYHRVEAASKAVDNPDWILWPDSVGRADLQEEIRRVVGAPDTQVGARASRSHRIIRFLKVLRESRRIPERAVVLDLACGDAVLLCRIKEAFPSFDVWGLDIAVGSRPTHEQARRMGVGLVRAYLQVALREIPARPVDVVLMLNTYRSFRPWIKPMPAAFREVEQMFHKWIARACRFVILTAKLKQLPILWRHGARYFQILGWGEGRFRSLLLVASGNRFGRWKPTAH